MKKLSKITGEIDDIGIFSITTNPFKLHGFVTHEDGITVNFHYTPEQFAEEWREISQTEEWDKSPIETGLGFVVAPTNYYEDGKKLFTWDEAMEIQEKLKDTGWRLPTVGELVQLYGKFGINKNGHDDVEGFTRHLSLPKDGYYYSNGRVNDQGTHGCVWSSTTSSSTSAYGLYFNGSYLNSQYSRNRGDGFSVRMVKEVKDE